MCTSVRVRVGANEAFNSAPLFICVYKCDCLVYYFVQECSSGFSGTGTGVHRNGGWEINFIQGPHTEGNNNFEFKNKIMTYQEVNWVTIKIVRNEGTTTDMTD